MHKQLNKLPHLLTMTLLAAALSACGQQGDQGGAGAQGPIPVTTVQLAARDVQVEHELPGRTVPYRVAEIRPQVGGIIQKRLFTEGGEVKAGQLLYQLDDASYKASFDSASATLAKAEANLASAKLKAERYQELVAINGVSKQDNDDAQAAYLQARADVAAAKAAQQSARINLNYSAITSPISGRIGKSAVTEGALLAVGQASALTTVQQLDPIYVDISQSSAELLRLKAQFAGAQPDKQGLPVKLLTEDGREYAHPGTLQFADATVDPETGGVTLRVLVPNPEKTLLPGMFVRAKLTAANVKNAVLVPQQAVVRMPNGGAMVMVVDAQSKVQAVPVKTARAVGDQWLITEGLKGSEQVIIEGLQKVQAGAVVKAELAKNAAKASAAAQQ
ncbi:efflux RND transporter periplasmic adaptor subunit [Chitinibacter tainanensis]|uniref:efflux RND transporter periplasmic adaptor subunit n=1 Tax=Chitinibacter tainanensis TaxID=230667 RepID=UPI00235757EF|nr:efflux RND transporter periplasmic adaptor subunit [Chitinibacter tainanensis]